MKSKKLLLAMLVLLLSACSTKLAYNYLDWILEWYAEDLVTLDSDQEWALIDAINSELAWHRKQQLPMYIQSLDDISTALSNGLDMDSAKSFYFLHEKGWMELKNRVAPTLARLLKTLNDAQVEELAKNLKEQEEELAEKYVDKPELELIKQRTERMVDRIEDWTGSLNSSQIQIVDKWSYDLKQTSGQWIETRRTWQSSLLQIVRQYRDKPEFAELIKELFHNSRKHWPQWYHDAYYYNVDLTLKMMVNLEKQLNDKQKRRLLGKIATLKQQFIELYEHR